MLGRIKDKAGGLVDRQRAGASGGVGNLASVDRQGLGLKFSIAHRCGSQGLSPFAGLKSPRC